MSSFGLTNVACSPDVKVIKNVCFLLNGFFFEQATFLNGSTLDQVLYRLHLMLTSFGDMTAFYFIAI